MFGTGIYKVNWLPKALKEYLLDKIEAVRARNSDTLFHTFWCFKKDEEGGLELHAWMIWRLFCRIATVYAVLVSIFFIWTWRLYWQLSWDWDYTVPRLIFVAPNHIFGVYASGVLSLFVSVMYWVGWWRDKWLFYLSRLLYIACVFIGWYLLLQVLYFEPGHEYHDWRLHVGFLVSFISAGVAVVKYMKEILDM